MKTLQAAAAWRGMRPCAVQVGGVGAAPHSGDPTNSESHTAEQTDECSDHGMVLRCAVAQTLSSQWRSLRHRGGEPTGPAASHCEEATWIVRHRSEEPTQAGMWRKQGRRQTAHV
ncbi:unnamed protein product [Durusdinium trenchii]|uniref:Uncharacterized protein n=1 Tax=Durusdinium trenchii TaxID=1381693 RepID=A0ABP0SV95_9DINO